MKEGTKNISWRKALHLFRKRSSTCLASFLESSKFFCSSLTKASPCFFFYSNNCLWQSHSNSSKNIRADALLWVHCSIVAFESRDLRKVCTVRVFAIPAWTNQFWDAIEAQLNKSATTFLLLSFVNDTLAIVHIHSGIVPDLTANYLIQLLPT